MAAVPFALAKDQATIEAPVIRVVDGDTFKLQGQTRSIPIWGLDAAERDLAGDPAATAALLQLNSGETVRCVTGGLVLRTSGRLTASAVGTGHNADGRLLGRSFRKGGTIKSAIWSPRYERRQRLAATGTTAAGTQGSSVSSPT